MCVGNDKGDGINSGDPVGLDAGLESLTEGDKCSGERNAEEPLFANVPMVTSNYNGKSQTCPPSEEIYYNVSTDEEDFTSGFVEYFERRQRSEGARIVWDGDLERTKRQVMYWKIFVMCKTVLLSFPCTVLCDKI